MSHQIIQSIFDQGAHMMFFHIKEQAISFDGLNPIYKNSTFMNELIYYFEQKEEYEKCKYLLMIRRAYGF
jgi:hypothetical protein